MKKTLFVLTAVVVAYFSFHATADPVSPATAAMAAVPVVQASDSILSLRQAAGDSGDHLPLQIIPDTSSRPAAADTMANPIQLKALTGFIQSTSEVIPPQTTAEAEAFSKSAHWGFLLIGFSALYMLTIRRNRAHL